MGLTEIEGRANLDEEMENSGHLAEMIIRMTKNTNKHTYKRVIEKSFSQVLSNRFAASPFIGVSFFSATKMLAFGEQLVHASP